LHRYLFQAIMFLYLMDSIDLHTHSIHSDGVLSPAALVDLAKNSGIRAVALTDHDTMAGLGEAMARGREQGIEVVPGVEISASHAGHSVHVLAYNPGDSEPLRQLLTELQQARMARNIKIIANLNRLGIAVTMAELTDYSPTGQIGRPHIARLLVNRGIVKSIDQAFDHYLRKGAKAYEESFKFPVAEVIQTISAAGGLAVLAHPAHIEPCLAALPDLLRILIPAGLAGIEVYHPAHSRQVVRELRNMAADYGLLLTGGSDYHGDSHAGLLGTAGSVPRISYELLVAMKQHPFWKKTTAAQSWQ
jgi:3',5'-nucleoside bisphosphate phosphatase